MALVLADRVRDTTTTTGTGTVTLSGTAPTGYQTFGAAIGNGNTTYYTINAGSQWEVGIGTYSSTGPTLARTAILASSNAGAAVDFAAGTKDVFVTYPAEKSVNYDASNNVGIGTTSFTNTVNNFAVRQNGTGVDLGGSASTGAIRVRGTSSGAGLIDFYPVSSDPNSSPFYLGRIFYDNASNFMSLATNSTERMRIDSSGNVGIGTSAPTFKLQVAGTLYTSSNVQFYDQDGFRFASAAAYTSVRIGSSYTGESTGELAYDRTNGAFTYKQGNTGSTLTERMRIDASGNVGIGTSSPSDTLTVLGGTSSLQANLKYAGTTQYSGSYLGLTCTAASTNYGQTTLSHSLDTGAGDLTATSFSIQQRTTGSSYVNTIANYSYKNQFWSFFTNGSERARIDSSGNVGIGTTVPQSKMEIRATSGGSVFNALTLSNYVGASVNTGVALYFDPNGAGSLARAASIQSVQSTSGNYADLRFFTANSDTPAERMRISANGDVTVGAAIITGSDSVGWGRLVNSGGALYVQAGSLNNGSATAQPIIFTNMYGGSERMRITDAGRVGIGISTPAGPLDVRGATGTTAIVNSYNTTTTGNVAGYFSDLQSTANSTSSYHYAGVTQGVNIWYLYGNGTSSWSSDQRLKKNIEATRDGYLDDLCKLRVVKYNWRTDDEDKPRELGLIAQEVEEVFPGLVEDALHTLDETEIKYKVLKGSVLPYMLIKALQEANAKIDALEARLTAMEGK